MKKKVLIPLWLSIAMVLGVVLGSKLNFADSTQRIFATNSKKDKLNRLIDYIDYEYVDRVNTDSIVDITVNQILENLDPHSVYIPVKDYAQTADDMRGAFTGIGISYRVYNDSVAVIKPLKDGPAKNSGILAGDRILFADGKQLYGKTVRRDSIQDYLKGEINSKVSLTVYRPSTKNTFDISLRRKEIPLKSITAAYKITDSLGYIRLNRFSEKTYKEFETALKDLIDSGITKLVLDLRDNPGGYISSAERIADEFLEKDKLILITKNKAGDVTRTYATRRGNFEDGKIYVLINENSASASEIVAGALQDNDKGVIVGRRSFGKGLVQREMELGDGSAVRLTVARYYTPTGRSIQRPYGDGNRTYYNEYEERYLNGELIHEDSIKVADSLRFLTPKGKIVYGGGGIIPDVFIPKDTSIENETIQFIANHGVISYFAFEFLDKNRASFQDIQFEDYLNNFEVDDVLIDEFIHFSRFDLAGIDINPYLPQLRRSIKASIAEQLYSEEEYEIILNQEDPMILKVLELESKDYLNN
ncbi:MAG: S41 family peptidase [Bacteroidetes bacterium]|jgi:carboxyl-terminal processing protease|nr:S41 family peptidase [Bacteroidota bacterium]